MTLSDSRIMFEEKNLGKMDAFLYPEKKVKEFIKINCDTFKDGVLYEGESIKKILRKRAGPKLQ